MKIRWDTKDLVHKLNIFPGGIEEISYMPQTKVSSYWNIQWYVLEKCRPGYDPIKI